jgi:holo-[acyl-carrier protein] synthase
MWPDTLTPAPYLLGNDLVAVERLLKPCQRYGQKAYATCLTPTEHAYVWAASSLAHTTERLASRLAAKEATAKALGVGLRGLGLADHPNLQATALLWREIEVVKAEAMAQPRLVLYGQAAQVAHQLGLQGSCLALSHQGGLALATVLLWR